MWGPRKESRPLPPVLEKPIQQQRIKFCMGLATAHATWATCVSTWSEIFSLSENTEKQKQELHFWWVILTIAIYVPPHVARISVSIRYHCNAISQYTLFYRRYWNSSENIGWVRRIIIRYLWVYAAVSIWITTILQVNTSFWGSQDNILGFVLKLLQHMLGIVQRYLLYLVRGIKCPLLGHCNF